VVGGFGLFPLTLPDFSSGRVGIMRLLLVLLLLCVSSVASAQIVGGGDPGGGSSPPPVGQIAPQVEYPGDLVDPASVGQVVREEGARVWVQIVIVMLAFVIPGFICWGIYRIVMNV
jgi:hypothetical protein